MRRRVGLMLLGLVAALFVATDSVWACKFLDGLFSRCRTRRCCVSSCELSCCPGEVSCCTPAVCGPVDEEDATAKPEEAPAETPADVPAETPAPEAPAPEAPAPEAPAPEAPAPEAPAPEAPAPEAPAPEAPAPEAPAPEAPAPEPPAPETPAETPADEMPEPPADQPAEGDSSMRTNTSDWRLWTDISGKHQLRARFVGFQEGQVRLQTTDGQYYRILLEKLSLADRALVRRPIESIARAR